MLVETRSLTKTYGRATALDHCDLAIPRGEVLGLLGPNGAGKTTLLRLLMGYLRPTEGAATIDGLDCYRQSVAVHRARSLSAWRCTALRPDAWPRCAAIFCDVRSQASLQRALDLADRLELDVSGQVSTFSTGMRQKLALAAVLAAETPLLILDEPTANLDPTVRSDVVAIVREAQQAGRTVVFSSHVLDEVEEACDRVCILRQGPTGPYAGDGRLAPPAPHQCPSDGPVATGAVAPGRRDFRAPQRRRIGRDRNAGRAVAAVGLASDLALGRGADRALPLAFDLRPLPRQRGGMMFNRALWRKAIGDARLLLLFLTALMFAFNWLFVYLSSLIELGPLAVFLQTLPPAFEKLSGVPFASVATPVGRISAAYVDPVVLFATTIWAVGRGSDAVSGEIGRGTMEMLVAQPVHRLSVLATQAAVTIGGSGILAIAVLVGTSMGLATVRLSEAVSWTAFVPGAMNLFAMMVFLSGVTHAGLIERQLSLADDRIGGRILRSRVGIEGDRPARAALRVALVPHVRHGLRAAGAGARFRAVVGPLAALRRRAGGHRAGVLRRRCTYILSSRFAGATVNARRAGICAEPTRIAQNRDSGHNRARNRSEVVPRTVTKSAQLREFYHAPEGNCGGPGRAGFACRHLCRGRGSQG